MMFGIFLLFCVVSASVVNGDNVLVYDDADFDAKIASHEVALVKFYAPWCGHCKKMAPHFESAAGILKNNDPPVALIKVDCTEGGKETCSKHGVSGYPTLKVFKSGALAFDYEGPRETDGIVRYMKSKAGPASKELTSVEMASSFIANEEHSIIGFFDSASSGDNTAFQQTAGRLSDSFRFAHTFSADVAKHLGADGAKVVIFQPPRLHTKLLPTQQALDQPINQLDSWINDNVHGLVGHRTTSNDKHFSAPLVTVFYNVDYIKNPKGSNYWRNRVIKVAQKFADKKVNFAVANGDEFSHEIGENGLDYNPEKVYAAAKGADGGKFPMKTDFSMDSLEAFVGEFLEGKLKAYLKSEPIPTDNTAPVKVVVAEQFNEIVNDPTKDVLIEFYAPWCGHCKSLAPKYEELAQKLSEESDIVIAKMDATANDVPAPYQVSGFPTLYFAPKNKKDSPVRYEGGREVDDFIKYLAKQSTDPLTKYTREGKKIKVKKTEL